MAEILDPPEFPDVHDPSFGQKAYNTARWMSLAAPQFNAVRDEVMQALASANLGFVSASTTSTLIELGAKTIFVESGRGYVPGMPIKVTSSASIANFMKGSVTSYNKVTGELAFIAATKGGAGTFANWSVSFDIPDASAPKVLTRNITSTDTLVASDAGKLITLAGTFTLGAAAANTLGDGWYCFLRTDSGTVTFDPNGSETVDGLTSGVLKGAYLLQCNGTSFTTVRFGGAITMQVLTSGTSWPCPLGVRSVKYRLVGGGAGTDNSAGRMVGTAGGYAEGYTTTVPGSNYPYTIGAAGGTTSPCTGGATTWNSTVTANGGTTGNSNIADGGSATGGDLNIKGASCLSNQTAAASTPLGNGGIALAGTATIIDPTGYGSGAAIYSGATSKPGRQGAIILEY